MKLTEISISVSRTFNLGNFESLRLEATASASVEDDTEEARQMILDECRVSLREAYLEHHPKAKKET